MVYGCSNSHISLVIEILLKEEFIVGISVRADIHSCQSPSSSTSVSYLDSCEDTRKKPPDTWEKYITSYYASRHGGRNFRLCW